MDYPTPNAIQPKQPFWKRSMIITVNLLIFLIYSIVIIGFNGGIQNAFWTYAGLYFAHFLILLALALVAVFMHQDKKVGQYGAMALAIIIIGFGTCTFSSFY